jgi:hypothetical protein
MGGAGAPEEIPAAVARLVSSIDRFTAEHSGRFWHAEGQELPW